MLSLLASLMVAAGLLLAALAAYVAWRRSAPAAASLAVLLLAVAWWGLAYAAELSATELATKSRWGDLKYVGIGALGPSWLAFVLQYTGRGHRVTRRLLLMLGIEPAVVLALLAVPATHDLVRFYPASAAGDELPVVGTGPVFWVHLVYTNALLLVATWVFVSTLVRISAMYWRMSVTMVAAALLPWVANLLHNLEVGPFARVDLTPFLFIVTGAVCVWGLFRAHLVNLAPVARGVIVDTMADAVFVLDAFRRVLDANPAAARVVGRPRTADLIGRSLGELLPDQPGLAPPTGRVEATGTQLELTLSVGGLPQHFDARRQPLPDHAGAPAGELVVLRDITERKAAELQLHELLAERTRVASALQASLLPTTLPQIPSCHLAGLYEPAGDGREIGGDFFDVFRVGPDEWGIVIGDVSGKGAEAAAVTALARYSLRSLASDRIFPSDVLRDLNATLLRDGTDERFCTAVYATARPSATGLQLSVSLGGHHQPLVRRATGVVEPVGRLGTALGLIEDPDLYDATVDLDPGDLLCLFTDGLVEARHERDLYGTENAVDVLAENAGRSPEEIVAALAASARRFHGSQLTDDLAVLVVRVGD